MKQPEHPLNDDSKIPFIVIVGETASGKSSLALEVAQKYNGEIISADSRTIYIGMDIGTAKPSKQQQKLVTHHGIDLIEPNEKYSAAQFKDYAYQTVKQIWSENKLPIMVGGTGLYVDGVLFNYSFSTRAKPEIRSNLNKKSVEELVEIVKKSDISVDSQTLQNKRQLIRLIERGEAPAENKVLPNNTLVVGISISRTSIRHNIETRVEVMFRNGLRREVDELVSKYGWDSEALTGIGYREFKDYHDGEKSMSKIKRLIVQDTLKYAKRQRTWLKRNQYIEWFASAEDVATRIDEYLTEHGYTKA